MINNYPLPNAKEDILEFAVLASRQVRVLTKMQATKTETMGFYGNNQLFENGVFGAVFGSAGAIHHRRENMTVKFHQTKFFIAITELPPHVTFEKHYSFLGEDNKRTVEEFRSYMALNGLKESIIYPDTVQTLKEIQGCGILHNHVRF